MSGHKQLILLSIGALVVALLPLPYGYYMVLRIFMCGLLAYLTFEIVNRKLVGLAWFTGITAAIYNPFVPLHLGKEVWTIINILTVILMVAVYRSYQPDENAAS